MAHGSGGGSCLLADGAVAAGNFGKASRVAGMPGNPYSFYGTKCGCFQALGTWGHEFMNVHTHWHPHSDPRISERTTFSLNHPLTGMFRALCSAHAPPQHLIAHTHSSAQKRIQSLALLFPPWRDDSVFKASISSHSQTLQQ